MHLIGAHAAIYRTCSKQHRPFFCAAGHYVHLTGLALQLPGEYVRTAYAALGSVCGSCERDASGGFVGLVSLELFDSLLGAGNA